MSTLAAASNNAATSAATTATATATNTGSSAVANSKVSPDVSSAIMLHASNVAGNSHVVKKHSTASSSLSSLASDEIVEVHHVDSGKGASNAHPSKMLPKLGRGKHSGRAASHQSHYSTDKSASSGYYSSNVCSTYSLEEHIYSEPTIDIKEKPLGLHNHKESVSGIKRNEALAAAALSANQNNNNSSNNNKIKPVEDACNNQHATLPIGQTSTAISVMRTLDYNRRYRYTDPNVSPHEKPATLPAPRAAKEFSENLRILESSIENLDRHLKTFPGLTSQDAIVSYVQNPYSHGNNEKTRSYAHLPTIKEAFDVAPKRGWPVDPVGDDSLMDIDLDSFLLDERKKITKTSQNNALATRKGVDNPTFLIGEQEENHYKCAKYINSCPEDAYRVESDIIAPTRSSISEQSVAMSVDLYPKRYEDQLHFQNTRELLEDVRDKIRLLTRAQESQDLMPAKQEKPLELQQAVEEYIPKELNSMISTLKRELELYLERMNQHSELEIRQLCTGLVNNQNIVKMKNAFERRRSLTDSTEHIASYEAVQGEMRALSGVPISIRQEITTIKCSSDPNFKMKRKSLAEVFPISECYIETTLDPETAHAALPPHGVTQLQRNLNFHQPQIQQFNKDNLESAKETSGSGSATASGSASGGETSETNDKDSILDWHRKKPSIWEMYYGTNRIQQSLLGASSSNKKSGLMVSSTPSPMCYPSSRPESDFTLDLPRAEQLRIKMDKEKKFRQRCRVITSFLSLIFFLLTVMVVSLVLTRGKRMFGSMI